MKYTTIENSQEFKYLKRLLDRFKKEQGDSNYQVFFDGESWGVVEDGTLNTIGNVDEMLTYLESNLENDRKEK